MNTITKSSAFYFGNCFLFRIVTLKIKNQRDIILHYYSTTGQYHLCLVSNEPITNSYEFETALYSIPYSFVSHIDDANLSNDYLVELLSSATTSFKPKSNMLSTRENLRRGDKSIIYSGIGKYCSELERLTFTLDQTGKGWILC